MSEKNSIQKDEFKKALTRGSPYPSLSLPDSVLRAKTLWEEERQSLVPVNVAVRHFGYAESSSGGRQTIATLLQFGLLHSEGSNEKRVVRLTERALTILLAEEESDERLRALKEAVWMPKLYSEILTRWPDGIPKSDTSISYFLLKEKNFNPKVLASFIRDLRASFVFASVGQSADATDSALTSGGPQIAPLSSPAMDLHVPVQVAHEVTVSQVAPIAHREVTVANDEIEWLRGALSKETTFRLLVKGGLGGREIGRLIKLLQAQKLILEEDDDDAL